MTFQLATTVDETYIACNPDRPLASNDPRYVDLSEVRGESNKIIKTIQRNIRRAEDNHSTFLVSGHRGCGKSTELLRLKDNLTNDNYFCVYFDVGDVLDLGDVQYIEVFISMVQAIAKALAEQNIAVDADKVDNISNWFQQTIIKETATNKSNDTKIQGSVEATGGVPLLLKLLAKFSTEIRLNNYQRETIRTEITNDSYGFITHLNDFLSTVNTALATNNKSLVVIIDGLEKIYYKDYPDGNNSHTEMFIRHADQLKSLQCHMIYTMPINLIYTDDLVGVFEGVLVLNMINLDSSDGILKFKEVLWKRIAVESVFENINDLEKLIKLSGGFIRDLLRLVRMSTDTDDDKISTKQIYLTMSNFSRDYDRLISTEDLKI